MAKYVILLNFYVSLLQKHKKHKNTRSKRIQWNICIMGFQTIGRQLKFQLNIKWIKCQILNHMYVA